MKITLSRNGLLINFTTIYIYIYIACFLVNYCNNIFIKLKHSILNLFNINTNRVAFISLIQKDLI